MSEHCCERMAEAVSTTCEQHAHRWDCPDALLAFWPDSGDYGLIVHDGGSSMITIDYCPFCGAKLAQNAS